jgi:hypothetical protein
LHVWQRSFCSREHVGPFVLVVRGDTVVERRYADAVDSRALPPPAPESAVDVDGLFQIVRDALARADAVAVRYDDELGYPTLIDVDSTFNAVDDETVIGARLVTSEP